MDGTAIPVTPSTQMHMGTAGKAIVLADLRPGDELVIVMVDAGSTPMTMHDATTGPSALPREATSETPSEAGGLMVFRNPQTP
jgi:hypothetical protein